MLSRKCDDFFAIQRESRLALTFDEVRLQTDHSVVNPAHADLRTKFSRRVDLNIPIVSAAMDTVTAADMAERLAKMGGLGILHRNNTSEEQADMVGRVKNCLHAFISKPITVRDNMKVADVLRMIEERRYRFHSFPVINSEGRVVGIMTGNDFDFCRDFELTVSEAMSKDLLAISGCLPLKEILGIMQENKKKILPVIEGGSLVGIYIFTDVKRLVDETSRIFNLDANGNLRVGAAIGIGEEGVRRAELCARKRVDVIVIDTAHADSAPVFATIEALKELRNQYPDFDIVAGNISNEKSARRLAEAGVDGIKVGQGPGSICKTRIIAGVGRPQLSAIYSCELAIRGYDIPICADGGIKYPGDIPIAIGAGAHSVMTGRLLAGTDECPGEAFVDDKGARFRIYRGMGSKEVMMQNQASDRYMQNGAEGVKRLSEGERAIVPSKGAVADVIDELVLGLRQGMGYYVGAATIEELRQKADFDRMTPTGMAESAPHSITIADGVLPKLCRV